MACASSRPFSTSPCTGGHLFARGQVSLEYLLVLIGALAFLSASFHFFSSLEEDSRFWMDVLSAKGFASHVQQQGRALSLMGDGSAAALETKILGEWRIMADGNFAELRVFGANGRAFSISLAAGAQKLSGKAFTKKLSVVLAKDGGKISLQD